MLGEDMSLAVRLIFALILVLALIGAAVLLLRRFGVGKLGSISLNGRAPRLAVMDIAHLDSRRKLIIVRRDTVEHLIMVGGPNDLLIEQGIVRGQTVHEERAAPTMPPMPKAQPRPAAPATPLAKPSTPAKTPEAP